MGIRMAMANGDDRWRKALELELELELGERERERLGMVSFGFLALCPSVFRIYVLTRFQMARCLLVLGVSTISFASVDSGGVVFTVVPMGAFSILIIGSLLIIEILSFFSFRF